MATDVDFRSPADGLSTVIDDHVRWLGRWHRAAFYPGPGSAEAAPIPASLLGWLQHLLANGLIDQPAVDRLVMLHERLHRHARLVLEGAAAGARPAEGDYEQVVGLYEEFMAQLRRMERAFRLAASGLDPLTGLRNRVSLMDDLRRELARFDRTGQPFCVALCDVDRFKSVNDRFGHEAGDRVLAAVAATIGRHVRSFDEVYRMGGEEFLICLKDADLAAGHAVVERLRAELAATPVALPDGRTLDVTASFGIVAAAAGLDVDRMIGCADRALYRAKHAGRNRVVRHGFDPLPDRPVLTPAEAAARGRALIEADRSE